MPAKQNVAWRVGGDGGDFGVALVLDLVRGERAEEGGEEHSVVRQLALRCGEPLKNPLARQCCRFHPSRLADLFQFSDR